MKKYILLIGWVMLISCSTPTNIKTDELFDATTAQLIYCEHKHDRRTNFTYIIEKSELYKVHETLTVYRFISPKGQAIFLNNYEIENYNCERVK